MLGSGKGLMILAVMIFLPALRSVRVRNDRRLYKNFDVRANNLANNETHEEDTTFCSTEHDKPNRRIVFYGGTFDPPTMAHLHIASVALAHEGIDCVWLDAIAHPVYKPDKTDIKIRQELLHMSLGELSDSVKLSNAYEDSYTDGLDLQRIDFTAYAWLEKKYPQTSFDMIVGADSLTPEGPYTVEGWRDILQSVARRKAKILVLARGDKDVTDYEKMLLDKWGVSPSPYEHLGYVDMRAYSEVSSSKIRELLEKAEGGKITPGLRKQINEAGLSDALLDHMEEHPELVLKIVGSGGSGPGSGSVRANAVAASYIIALALQMFLS